MFKILVYIILANLDIKWNFSVNITNIIYKNNKHV